MGRSLRIDVAEAKPDGRGEDHPTWLFACVMVLNRAPGQTAALASTCTCILACAGGGGGFGGGFGDRHRDRDGGYGAPLLHQLERYSRLHRLLCLSESTSSASVRRHVSLTACSRGSAGFGGGGRFDDEPTGGARWRGGAPTSPTAGGGAAPAPGERQSLTVRFAPCTRRRGVACCSVRPTAMRLPQAMMTLRWGCIRVCCVAPLASMSTMSDG